jgi:hypothetical protein
MANSNGRHLSQRGTKLNHTAVLSPSSEQSNAQEITMEDINLHLEDEDEFEDIAAGEIMEGEDSDGFELIHSEAQVSEPNPIVPWETIS